MSKVTRPRRPSSPWHPPALAPVSPPVVSWEQADKKCGLGHKPRHEFQDTPAGALPQLNSRKLERVRDLQGTFPQLAPG